MTVIAKQSHKTKAEEALEYNYAGVDMYVRSPIRHKFQGGCHQAVLDPQGPLLKDQALIA
jgi:hypothetical protein